MNKLTWIDTYNKAATKIQTRYRGFAARRDNRRGIEDVKNKAQVLETYRSDKYMIDQFVVHLKKFKLTPVKFYRICDEDMRRKITTKTFIDQINKLGIEFTEETTKKLVLVFDEDFNEEISYAEFIDACDAYGAGLPSNMPSNYISVAKRSLIKLVKKMKKKNKTADRNSLSTYSGTIFRLKDNDTVSAKDFMEFINNTLRVNLKKREQHALIELFDTNKNNIISESEFANLIKKGEKMLDKYPKVLKFDYFDPIDETHKKVSASRTKPDKSSTHKFSDSDSDRSDPKLKIIKAMISSPNLSIEDYFEKECDWTSNTQITFKNFKEKLDSLFDIPGDILKNLFDECNFLKKNQIKVGNIVNVLKPMIKKLDNEYLSLYTIEDVNRDYEEMTPRSGTSLLVEEINDQCASAGYKTNEVFNSFPKLSREVTEEALKGFEKDRIDYNEFLTFFDTRDPKKPKTEDMKSKARTKWIAKYTEVLNKYELDPETFLNEVDKNKDGTLELNELSKAIKTYIKHDDLSYNDLRNIIDALDSNNDGKVSTKEYKDAIAKFGVKPEVIDYNAAESIAEKVALKICKKYNDKFDKAIQEFNNDNNVDISNSSVRKGCNESKFISIFCTNAKLASKEDASMLYKAINNTNSKTNAVVTGKEIYIYLSKKVDDSNFPKPKVNESNFPKSKGDQSNFPEPKVEK